MSFQKKKNRLRRFFNPLKRASGFEMRNSFQASQNTTCRCPATTFLVMVFN